MLHTPLDKLKGKVRDFHKTNTSGSEAESPVKESQFHRGWLWKDEGNNRQLTRLFVTLDKSNRRLVFSNIEMPLEHTTPSQIKGSVDLVPGHCSVTPHTAAAFGSTVHMLEISDNMAGETYRFTGEKHEL